MTDINDFFKMMAAATKAKEEADKLAEERAAQEFKKKEEAAAPFLNTLFKNVAEAKVEVEKQKEEEKQKAQPILSQLEQALKNPEQFKKATKQKKQEVLKVVKELEEKAAELEEKLADAETSVGIEERIEESKLEKKFLDMFKLLQDDLIALKRQVSNIPTGLGWGGGGSGEVNLRYLDDVDRNSIRDGRLLSYDDSIKKFKFVPPPVNSGGSGNINTIIQIITLNGYNVEVDKADYGITTILSKIVVDPNEDEISVVMKTMNGIIQISSNVLLDGHSLILTGI